MSQLPLFARALRCVATVFAFTVLLGGCDSSSRIEDYVPTRVISFGDELSTIEADGRKYSINGFATGSATADCSVNPIWNQALATNFGLAFTQCPGAIVGANGVMGAIAGSTVDAIDAQIAAVPSAQLVPSTLVTIQGGMHDILAAYNTYRLNANRDAAFQLMADKGAQLRLAIKRIAANGTGARVIYGTVPDLGISPMAIADQANNTSNVVCAINCQTFLSDLTAVFNSVLRVGAGLRPSDDVLFSSGSSEALDGRHIALVTFDDMLRSMADVRFSNPNYGLLRPDLFPSTTVAACIPTDLRTCTTTTLVPELAGSATGYLWASDRLPGPNWHSRVAGVAITRARNNPF